MPATVKKQLFELVDASHADDGASRAFNLGMIVLISLNILVVILETEEGVYSHYRNILHIFDAFSVAVFSVEYILRLWTCTEDSRYRAPISGRIRYAFTASMLIDLISILPFYIPLSGMDLRFLRAVRLFRMFRLLKMARYSQSLRRLGNVLKAKREELAVTLFSGMVLLLIASSLMYYIEHEAQPEAFPSILSSMWWGAVTLTTVGYGDIYPHTALGKLIGASIAVMGIGLFALPAGIIASGFAAELEHKPAPVQICPHCGKDVNVAPEEWAQA